MPVHIVLKRIKQINEYEKANQNKMTCPLMGSPKGKGKTGVKKR